jgi:hypothetical protein
MTEPRDRDEEIVAKMRRELDGHPDIERIMSEFQVWLATPGMAQVLVDAETAGAK